MSLLYSHENTTPHAYECGNGDIIVVGTHSINKALSIMHKAFEYCGLDAPIKAVDGTGYKAVYVDTQTPALIISTST